MKKQFILIGVFIMLLTSFFGCSKSVKISDITSIRFFYTTGTAIYDNVSYSLELKDGVYTATIKPQDIADEDALKIEVDEAVMVEIKELLKTNKVGKWNGFQKSNHNVLDGNSFSLSIYMKNSDSINAGGYMKWPNNYREVRDGLDSIFMKIYNENAFNKEIL